ncbi:hypothetical protein NPIL_109281 [Nephila pilipes]|uniref:Uncharacterized protein n=1 Tax=Nephila pilipes TaxID=299642 RepID=A0A8X6MQ47_NEPPI|nr:hypothetical protein NPIL_109281 [Nephila pilipes]
MLLAFVHSLSHTIFPGGAKCVTTRCYGYCKEAMVNFRLKFRHDCLAKHQKRIGILTNSLYPICKSDTMNRVRLFVCPGLDPILPLRGDVCLLYWSARGRMS